MRNKPARMTRSDGEVTENKKFDLEDRLVKFACMCLDVWY
jgi:hypothetical protein